MIGLIVPQQHRVKEGLSVIDHVWTVVCSHAVIDKDSNNVSLHNIIEQLNIKAEPRPDGALAIPFEVVTLWQRADYDTPCQGRQRLSFLTPLGEELGSFEADINLSTSRRQRNRMRFQHLPAREAGRHVFQVELRNEGENEWRKVAAIPIELIFQPPETEEAESES